MPRPRVAAALTLNFVDEANLRCHLGLLRPAAGQKLRRLFYNHQAEGMPVAEAAHASADEPLLAYYAHLYARAAELPSDVQVEVAEAHTPWEEYFGSQGPYAEGGTAALSMAKAQLVAKLVTLLEEPPPPGKTAEEDAASLLDAFERILVPPATGGAEKGAGGEARGEAPLHEEL